MGACEFSVETSARTAAEAYRRLVDTAERESGTDPYNGTISTTSGFAMVQCRAGENLGACADRILASADDDAARPGAKWGAAACLDLGPDPDAPELRRFRFVGWAAC